MTAAETTLPTFESCCRKLAAAERGDGWLSDCTEEDRFLLINRQLIASLADLVLSLDAGGVLEICAGAGELATALRCAGVPVVATDADPPAGSNVRQASAEETLKLHRPAVVLGCFVPVDAGVDEAVLGFPSVRHYVVLSARIGGLLGSDRLWQHADWTAEPLEQISRWMLTRHDVWIGSPQEKILPRGEAWHFSRLARGSQ